LGEGAGGAPRFRAFISYSHRDALAGRRIHRWLERYVVPRRLVGRETAQGPASRRVGPIFRDREEFSAAGDLSVEVRAALGASAALIVVCSPSARASPWVAREVETFRALHPDRPILAALVEGEPGEAFPEALTQKAGATVEPLAADFRAAGDGPRLALLKLVAGVVGLRLDELVQRDAQRRLANVMAVTATAFTAMLAMGLLTIFALAARAEAQRQRTEAEALVEFMLTDLHDRLEGVGRLDVLTAVNKRAFGYYADQDLKRLPPTSLERRARVLHAMGADDLARGDLASALTKFSEAERTTAALLAAAPNDPERIWAHGQSRYWVGYIDYQRGRHVQATQAWTAYRDLADRLVRQAPKNPKYLREAGYAEGNLCTAALDAPADPATAKRTCTAALVHMEAAAAQLPGDPGVSADLANRHAWLADADRASGDTASASAHRLVEAGLLDSLIAADPRNMALKARWVASQRALASLEFRGGDKAAAKARLEAAMKTLDGMIAFDPANHDWAAQRARLQQNLTLVSGGATTH
jgi:hypothetical protein